jgi:hypothetical protein
MKIQMLAIATLSLCLCPVLATAGPVSPDCTPDKAAKHVAEKSTTGVSTNRCPPGKTAKSEVTKTAGVDQKGPIEKKTSKNDTPADKAKDAVNH